MTVEPDHRPEPMFEKIKAAAKQLTGHAHITPVLTSRTLNRKFGAEIYFKCENFQRIGAFKFRGAYVAASNLSDAERKRGIVTYSSGNHAQAVALVGRILGIQTVVVMPSNAPSTKRSATEAYGARVVEYDPEVSSRDHIARELQSEHGYTLIPPYDHPDVIAGQGTAAMELLEKIGPLDQLLVPCGGGGLLSGSAIAAKALAPACEVIGIEPETADDANRSYYSGRLHTVHNPPTIADGTRTPSLGNITFPLVLEHVDAMATVPEEAIMEAVRFFLYRMKIVVEPSGALGLAALLCDSVRPSGRTAIMVSGGNIDAVTMMEILQGNRK
ncbi:L-threo-3-hydroxyaspartate ammonia-lyase (EC [Olavius algarvensis associated proteobacterium Delta 3]|nr:L-threo-3-hydroxyaspartate ammonia-lyase (EC [Olavius algarvensis associated proteobacterium Delta 3]